MTHLATEAGVVAAGSVGVMSDVESLNQRAREWIAGDLDPETRAELQAIVDSGDIDELEERMGASLEFGTAGIRGAVAAGSNRMNRAVVIKTTKGLADYLGETRDEIAPVVVGFDGRTSSRRFAGDTVGVLTAAGFPVRYFAKPTPTPLVAFAAGEYEAGAAVVVTASHNPPADNGYKVYDANTAQIIPPVDAGIAAAIARTGPAAAIPRHEWQPGEKQLLAEAIGSDLAARYVEEVMALRPDLPGDRDLTIVYTPLHGVGRPMTERLLSTAGFDNVHTVPEQAEPDGRFPTVAFPNPEEPGALDLAKGLGDRLGADLILANDPDADRLAACLPTAAGWRTLSGNQIGVLLADFVLENSRVGRPLVVNSIVSSPMLAGVAAGYGARFVQTLTGFKWIANAAMDLERDEGLDFVFGYEEALGYTVGPVVRDKDGMSAALWFADLVAYLRGRGRTIEDRLAALYRDHGLWVSTQRSIVRPGSEGAAEIAAAMGSLRDRRPSRLGGFEVDAVTDFRDGAADRPRWLPEQALVEFRLGGAGRALARPSGTEPKLKIYVDRRAELPAGADVWEAEAAALAEAAAVAADLAEFLGL
jgi:phosphomannomutase